ncbi:hypothetical protein [Desulfobacula sp.]|uniref:hypothetical protein n=1 Tax=Desulfobacula sp. TaxID=2593537 RepID=UPI001ED727CB|nr:hypothetical protein [Desulfobacula sp.]
MKLSGYTYRFLLIILFILFTTSMIIGCSKKIAGIPVEEWNQMSEIGRQAAMRGYNERQKIIAEERLVKAKQRAAEQAEEMRLKKLETIANQEKVAHVYAGEGIYGDLIQVTVKGGQLYFFGKHKDYQPLSFRIANGERKQVTFVRQTGNSMFQEINVWMAYQDGNFIFDCGEKQRMEKYGRKFSFSLGKSRVTKYQHVTLSKHSDSKAMDVNISIEVIPFEKMHHNTERIIIIK